MREVYVKSREDQDIALLHNLAQNTIWARTKKTNSLMSILLEFGFDGGVTKTRFLNQMEDLVDQALKEGYISSFTHIDAVKLIELRRQDSYRMNKPLRYIDTE